MDHFPDNATTNYTVKLPKHISLKGAWEVALTEIQYPFSWYNVIDSKNLLVAEDREGRRSVVKIPQGYYSDFELFLKTIKLCGLPESMRLSHGNISRKVTVSMTQGGKLHFFTGLAEILGFFPNTVIDKSTRAPNMANLQNISSLYVYCDLVDAQLVGDTHAPLLRIVNVEGKHGEMIRHTFHTPYFLPLRSQEIETVEVYIRDETGSKVPFQGGKVIVTLAFRKRRPTLM